MAKLAVFEAAVNLCLSPFRDTEFEKKRVYIRRPVPWDTRKAGVAACTPAQHARQDALVSASRAASAKCPKTGTMSTNICRLKAISTALKPV
ncbi:hypothetical protein ES703_16875 [subsurface metagenome]